MDISNYLQPTYQSSLKEKQGEIKEIIWIKKEDSQVGLYESNDFVDKIGTLPLEQLGASLFERLDHFPATLTMDASTDTFTMSVIRYAPLHGHSGYSLLDGASHIKDMAAVAEYAMALTDHGNMYGMLEFYKTMKKAGKKPILGCEVYSESRNGKQDRNHLLLLAQNETGYHNLLKLVSMAYENIYYKPQVKWEWLEKYHEGLVATSACLSGELDVAILRGDEKEARHIIENMIRIFGKENYFIEIQRHGIKEEEIVNPKLVALAKEYDLKVIASADSHYTHEEDREAQEILLCISTKTTIDNPKRLKFDGHGYHIHSSEEMVALFSDMPEVLDNTLELAERLNAEIEMNVLHMPNFDIPAPFADAATYFEHLTWEGFHARFDGTPHVADPVYLERTAYELSVINKMGFPGYFLIMWDVIKFAKDNGMVVGPGRGSACGSLVAYCLNITEVDSIKYDLLFERFLNEDRYSMPDIDTDFPDDRREEVIEYCRQKYGEKSVARIMTVTRLTAKSVIRDVSRVLGYPYSLGSKISDSIPAEPGMTIQKAFEDSAEFSSFYQTSEDAKKIIDLAIKLENTPKTTGVHACGVIISPSDVDNFIPTYLTKDSDSGQTVLATQYDKDQNEECGLLKMDFLGLRTMGVVSHCLDDVNKKRKRLGQSTLTMNSIPKLDVEMYQNIAKGNTAGVFQLEQPGMTGFMKQLFQDYESYTEDQAEELYERLFAGIALYRPGPMDEIPNYIKNMLDRDHIEYDVAEVEPVLKNTYGVIVYQEQCMRIVRDLAGFSRGQSDIIRKGMAKKQLALLNEYAPAFIRGAKEKNIKGCIDTGIPEAQAQIIWDKMIKFSKYAFNKSHAVGYAFVSASTGYLATHYPVEYLTATLNSFIKKGDRIKKYISVAKKQGVAVKPPDINKSNKIFTVDGDSIRFGLQGIHSLGKSSDAIIRERNRHGEFKDYRDFITRMTTHESISSNMVQALIYAGAFDTFPGTRKEKLSIAPFLIDYAKFVCTAHNSFRHVLFDMPFFESDRLINFELSRKDELDKEELLAKEKKYAGFYITGHPIENYPNLDKHTNYETLADLNDALLEYVEQKEIESYEPRKLYSVAGVIIDKPETRYSKKGNAFCTFTIEDMTGEVSCVAFSATLAKHEKLIAKGELVYLTGHVRMTNKEMSFTVNDMMDLHELRLRDYADAYVLTGNSNEGIAKKQQEQLEAYALKNPNGQNRIKMIFRQGKNGKETELNGTVPVGIPSQNALMRIVGQQNVKTYFEK